MDKNKIVEKLTEALQKAWDESQKRPDQYVVAYYRKKDDTLIGYHLSSFCQITNDIMEAKRYAGENPYPQLETINKNLSFIFTSANEGIFKDVIEEVKQQFDGLTPKDIYIDAIYLSEGMPLQEMKYNIITPNE